MHVFINFPRSPSYSNDLIGWILSPTRSPPTQGKICICGAWFTCWLSAKAETGGRGGENTVYTYMNITAGRGEGAEVGGWNFQWRTSRKNKGIKYGESERKSMCPRCNVRVRQLCREMEAVWHWNQNKDSSIMRGRWWVEKKRNYRQELGVVVLASMFVFTCFHWICGCSHMWGPWQ